MKVHRIFSAVILLAATATIATSLPCAPKDFERGSVVCVCNSTYCDTQEPLSSVQIGQGQYYHVVSTKGGAKPLEDAKRFDSKVVTVQAADSSDINMVGPFATLVVDREVKYQPMMGFGAAFTDAGGINLNEMTEGLRDNIMKAYFADDGIEFTFQRVPIGGSDFSPMNYTLCDEEGLLDELEHFSLQPLDFDAKIPYIKRAQQLQPNLKLFASPWSAPPWMKTNKDIRGGQLEPMYYQSWADYFVKFFDAYKENNVTFWGLTPQNEPVHGTLVPGEWNSMGWWPNNMRDFIKENLGPSLAEAGYGDLKLMINDDQRFQVTAMTRAILNDPEAAKYVSGIGLHWYSNFYFPPDVLDLAHREFPEYFMINTEACTGYLHFLGIERVSLGSWERAQYYAHNIIEDLNHWLQGWVEWNLVLDMEGGVNWAGNMVDAPVIFNKASGEAYKQPMYYALGHFSKYINEGAVRIYNSGMMNLNGLQILSVLRPDNKVVLVVYNKQDVAIPLLVQDSTAGRQVRIEIEPRSINTIVYSDLSEPMAMADGAASQLKMSVAALLIAFIATYLHL